MKLICVAVIAACRGGSAPVAADSASSQPRDAAVVVAVSIDAAAHDPACRADEAPARAFRFGTLTAPPGWCWRRTAEGDDQSGVLLDDHANVRMRYFELSFDEKVGDACDAHRPGVRAIRAAQTHGVAIRTGGLDDGRHCYSFHGLANLCTELPEAGFSPDALIRTLR